MKNFYLLFSILFCQISFSQTISKVDSLKRVLAKLPKEGSSFGADTSRVRVLLGLSDLIPVGKEDSSIKILNTPLYISNKIDWQLGLCIIYHKLGFLHMGKNETLKGVEYLFKSLAIAEKNNYTFYVAKNNKNIGDGYSILGDFNRAKKHLQKSIEVYKNLKLKKEYLIAMSGLGLVYFDFKKFKVAAKYFRECLKQNEISKIKVINAYFLINLGSAERDLGNYGFSIKCFERANAIIDNESGNPFTKIINIISIAEVHYLKNDLTEALFFLKQADKLHQSKGTEVSEEYLCDIYYKVYSKIGNKGSALKYFERYIVLNNMASKQDYEKKIQNLQATFDNENKEIQITLLNKNIQQETTLRNISIGGVFFVMIFVIWFWQTNKKLSEKNRTIGHQQTQLTIVNNQLEEFNKMLEEKVLFRTVELEVANKSLIKKNEEIVLALVEGQTIERKRVASELHDNLGATLSAIKWRLETINAENLSINERKIYESTMEMMRGAYSEIRLISHNLLPAELEKGGFDYALEKFISDINTSNKIKITYKFQSSAIPTSKKVQLELYGISLELINNIIKHSNAKTAQISLYEQNNQTIFEISDDSTGFYQKDKAQGMGMQNIENRLKALDGTINYHSNPNGLLTRLRFPS